jgi:2-polyprenyl-3-methyl-5-hydroxy-6-metoxy-1,4-benzoquinol methylase
MTADRSNGYEGIAREFMSHRTESNVGSATVRDWANALPRAADVLDLGCGHGLPISAVLAAQGANLYGVDASPTMIAAYRDRFPDAHAECNAVEESEFFGRRFDAAVAWGLMFLLRPETQPNIISKVSAALKPGGMFLFTAPQQACEWEDNLTGKTSVSLGAQEYRRLIQAADLDVFAESEDEGQNYYFSVRKRDGNLTPRFARRR